MKNLNFTFYLFPKQGFKKKILFWKYLIFLSLLLMLILNFKITFRSMVTDLKYIAWRMVYFPGFSYEDKMKEKVGKEYFEWTKLVREYTSVKSLVFHPPQMTPWPESGNPEFSQYFLYPTKLIREDRERLYTKKDITNVMIVWGEETEKDERLYGWPKFPVFAQKIYYLPQRRVTEVKGLDGLKEWKSNSERIVEQSDSNKFVITYTSSEYDYWMKPVDLPLLPNSKFSADVKSNWPNSVALVVEVDYGQNKKAVFSSPPNSKVDEWGTIELDDLYLRAYEFAQLQGWAVDYLRLSKVGLDLGHPAKMPYLEKWGIIEVETANNNRQEMLERQVINSQTYLSLGNVHTLMDNNNEALSYYKKSLLLEPSNHLTHLGVATAAVKLNRNDIAEQEYQLAIKNNPEEPWLYYSLGDYYRFNGDLSNAKHYYQSALDRSPDSSWANLGMGEVYFAENRIDLAAKYYRLASSAPRRDFVSDGKTAYAKLKVIEDKQKNIINELIEKTENNVENLEDRVNLGKAYTIIGDIDNAQKQFEFARKTDSVAYDVFGVPPTWVDQLSRPLYLKKGLAVETEYRDSKLIASLDNYHSYLTIHPDLLPKEGGTIEINWKYPEDHNQNNKINIFYQFEGFTVWLDGNIFYYGVYNKSKSKWEVSASNPVSLDKDKWYRLGVSYGNFRSGLYLDGKEIIQTDIGSVINGGRLVYLGRGVLWAISSQPVRSGYFDSTSVYNYEKRD